MSGARCTPTTARGRDDGGDGGVSLWDCVTGELLGSVSLPENVTSAAAFGADENSVVIASDYGGLYSWDTSAAYAIEFADLPRLRPIRLRR